MSTVAQTLYIVKIATSPMPYGRHTTAFGYAALADAELHANKWAGYQRPAMEIWAVQFSGAEPTGDVRVLMAPGALAGASELVKRLPGSAAA